MVYTGTRPKFLEKGIWTSLPHSPLVQISVVWEAGSVVHYYCLHWPGGLGGGGRVGENVKERVKDG